MLDRLLAGSLILLTVGLVGSLYLVMRGPATAGLRVEHRTPPVAVATHVSPPRLTDSDLRAVWHGFDPLPEAQPVVLPPALVIPAKVPDNAGMLGFKVTGIIIDPQHGPAVFVKAGDETGRAGIDDIVNGWQIVAVDRFNVTVRKNGDERVLAIEAVRSTAMSAVGAKPANQVHRAVVTGEMTAKTKVSSAGIRSRGETGDTAQGITTTTTTAESTGAMPPRSPSGVPRVAVAREDIQLAQVNPQAALEGVQVRPNLVNGKMDGFLLSSVEGSSKAAAYGLAPGDRIVKINDQPIDSAVRALELYDRYRRSTSLKVTIVRDGKPQDIMYYVR